MEVTSIVTGSWFPRTKLHIKEFDTFLKKGTSHLPLDAKKLQELRASLDPKDVSYNGARFDFVRANLDGTDVTFYEDGLLLLSRAPGKDISSSIAELADLYGSRLAPALTYLYSLGSPMLSQTIPHIGKRPTMLLVREASDADVDALVRSLGDSVHFVARQPRITVHFADHHIIVVHDAAETAVAETVVRSLILFREYEHKLRHFLDLHRTIWESISDIHGKDPLRIRDLPEIRDRLLDFKRDLAVSKTRLGQMRSYLPARKHEVDEVGLEEVLRGLEAYRFEKVEAASSYMDELWHMLADYIESTVQITDLLYQENLQKEINFEQFIFLVASVAAVVELGAIAAAKVSLTDPETGAMLTGSILEFSMHELLVYGGFTLLASIVIFNILKPLIGSFRRVKTKELFRGVGSSGADEGKL
jgi:hypothetical protein